MIVNKYSNGGGGSGSGYTLPVATETRLGGVKVGSGLTIDSGGTLSDEATVIDLSALSAMTSADRVALWDEVYEKAAADKSVFMKGAVQGEAGRTAILPIVSFRPETAVATHEGGNLYFAAKGDTDNVYFHINFVSDGTILPVGGIAKVAISRVAAADTLGMVKVGSGLTMDGQFLKVNIGDGLAMSGNTIIATGGGGGGSVNAYNLSLMDYEDAAALYTELMEWKSDDYVGVAEDFPAEDYAFQAWYQYSIEGYDYTQVVALQLTAIDDNYIYFKGLLPAKGDRMNGDDSRVPDHRLQMLTAILDSDGSVNFFLDDVKGDVMVFDYNEMTGDSLTFEYYVDEILAQLEATSGCNVYIRYITNSMHLLMPLTYYRTLGDSITLRFGTIYSDFKYWSFSIFRHISTGTSDVSALTGNPIEVNYQVVSGLPMNGYQDGAMVQVRSSSALSTYYKIYVTDDSTAPLSEGQWGGIVNTQNSDVRGIYLTNEGQHFDYDWDETNPSEWTDGDWDGNKYQFRCIFSGSTPEFHAKFPAGSPLTLSNWVEGEPVAGLDVTAATETEWTYPSPVIWQRYHWVPIYETFSKEDIWNFTSSARTAEVIDKIRGMVAAHRNPAIFDKGRGLTFNFKKDWGDWLEFETFNSDSVYRIGLSEVYHNEEEFDSCGRKAWDNVWLPEANWEMLPLGACTTGGTNQGDLASYFGGTDEARGTLNRYAFRTYKDDNPDDEVISLGPTKWWYKYPVEWDNEEGWTWYYVVCADVPIGTTVYEGVWGFIDNEHVETLSWSSGRTFESQTYTKYVPQP